MSFIKATFYTVMGCLLVLFHREGHDVLMSWAFLIWILPFAWDLASTLTPYQKTQKKD